MVFKPVWHTSGRPTDWDRITHVRLIPGRRPDKPHALERWEVLKQSADAEGLIPKEKALGVLKPVRTPTGRREASIERDLRNWSNPVDHGNNSQDKGWLELGVVE